MWTKTNGTMKRFSDVLTDDVKRVGISGHQHPDGDCAGSVLGLYHYLMDNFSGIEIVPYLELPLSGEIAYLLQDEPACPEDGIGEVFDLMFVLDSATPDRLSAGSAALRKAKHVIVIDHHETDPGYGHENYIDGKASSTCECLTRFMDMEKISQRTAECLYSGILFDTNVFRYDCTGPETLRTAAALLEKGVPFAEIIRKSFTEQSYTVAKITAAITSRAVLIPEEEFLYAVADLPLLHECGVTSADIGSVVSDLNNVRETETTLLMYQYEDGSWKGSLRSKARVDVSCIAHDFGGGGHARAAGFSFADDPIGMMEKVRKKVRKQLQAAPGTKPGEQPDD